MPLTARLLVSRNLSYSISMRNQPICFNIGDAGGKQEVAITSKLRGRGLGGAEQNVSGAKTWRSQLVARTTQRRKRGRIILGIIVYT